MGGDAGKMIVPMALAIAAPYAAGAALGVGSSAGLATGVTTAKTGALVAGKGASLLSQALVPIANTSFMGSLITGAGLAYANSMETPEAPDYSGMFAQQQGQLTEQQSFGRRPTGELEQMLEYGTDYEKNQAYNELQRRGEDETRLMEIQTRRDRTDERQAEIDD